MLAQPQRPRGLLRQTEQALLSPVRVTPTSLLCADVFDGLYVQCQHITSFKDGDWCRAKGSDDLRDAGPHLMEVLSVTTRLYAVCAKLLQWCLTLRLHGL